MEPETSQMGTQRLISSIAVLTNPGFDQPCGQHKVGNHMDYGVVSGPSLVPYFNCFFRSE
jgi:hypothetical protein